MANKRADVTPKKDPDAPSDETQYLDGLTFEETFHVGQSLGRVLERLDNQTKRIEDLKELLDETDKKVSRLIREFGFIKKAWWIALIALGFAIAELIDYLPAIFSSPSG